MVCACILWQSIQAQERIPGVPDLKSFKAEMDSCEVNLRAHRRPVIGLSVSRRESGISVSYTYINAVLNAGGAPVVIPAVTDGMVLREIVSGLDGLIMIGGEDANPLWFNEEPRQQLGEVDQERDEYDIRLIRLAADRNIPTLGICRGEQLINVAFGGTLYQDIPSQHGGKNLVKHQQKLPGKYASHTVTVTPGSQLAALIGQGLHGVNSFHHQAVKDVAPGFRIVALSTDSIPEAIEAWPYHPVLGVQWHPEILVTGSDTTMCNIFRFLVNKADTFHLAKEIHRRIFSVDTHVDTPLWFNRPGFNIADRERNRVNLPKMEEGMLDGVFFAAYIRQGERDEASSRRAVEHVDTIIRNIHKVVEENSDLCAIARTSAAFARIKGEGKKAIFIGIENGYAIGKDITNIARFKDLGVLYMTLCHSYDNDICDTSTHTQKAWGGLSAFGQQVVREMNRVGMMIDLSHVGESTFWDVMKLTAAPVICSHSSARALCESDRNLTDDQLRAIAQNGGVVQVCLLNEYLNSKPEKASIEDAIAHIDHIVKVAGMDHVGIGSDFDGGGGITGCEGANDLIQITVKLLERGYSEEDIAKIWGGNLLRVMNEVQAKGK